jgi:hypothetical protein
MHSLALVLLGASLLAMALGALGMNRSRTPNATYLSAILGAFGICGLLVSLLLAWFGWA